MEHGAEVGREPVDPERGKWLRVVDIGFGDTPPSPERISRIHIGQDDHNDGVWDAAWENGKNGTSRVGDRDSIIAWAKSVPADERYIFDTDLGDYIPLT